MRHLGYLWLLLPLLLPVAARGQNVSVSSAQGQDIGTFLNQHLVGNGVYIFNPKFNNVSGNINSPQIGTFLSNGYTMLQMDTGVVLTTGHVDVVPGPNNNNQASHQVSTSYVDGQMASWTGSSITGCGTIDFDFVSVSPYVSVNYVFGSEEYPEYVCSEYNDVFAFLVNPVSNSSQKFNAAIIPHSVSTAHPNGIEVTVNSVNQGMAGGSGGGGGTGCYYTYTDFYVMNHAAGASGSCNNQPGVQYDGFTQKLSANATLTPCEPYHMHISVCNAGSDQNYDSGVFLEEGSFNSPSADVDLSLRYADTVERSRTATQPLSLAGTYYTYGHVTATFGGDAVVGSDYTLTTDSNRTIDAEHNTFYIDEGEHWLSISPTDTADLSSPKSVEIYLATSLCANYPALKTYDTLRYVLREDDVVRLYRDTLVAYDTCHEVGVRVEIGEPTVFHWMPEDGIDFPRQQYSTALITESRLYRVAAADERGHTDTASIYVEVRPRTAVETVEAVAEPRVYPNPTDGLLTVEAVGMRSVELYNADGVVVYRRNAAGERLTIDTRGMAAGVYMLRVAMGKTTWSEKVVVK